MRNSYLELGSANISEAFFTAATGADESVTVTVTEYVPVVVGVPEIIPAEEIVSPGGRPVAVQV